MLVSGIVKRAQLDAAIPLPKLILYWIASLSLAMTCRLLLAMTALFIFMIPVCATSDGNIEYVRSSKNLGVGLTDPQAKFHVNGDVISNSTINGVTLLGNGDALIFNGNTFRNSNIYTSSVYQSLDLSNGFILQSTVSHNPLLVDMELNLNGAVTVRPAYRFSVSGLNSSLPPSFYSFNGSVGINTDSPSTDLDINGQVMIRGANPGVNKLLISDANGLASWQSLNALPEASAENLDSLNPNVFLRSDTSDTFESGTFTFDSGTSVVIDGALNLVESSSPSQTLGYGKLYVGLDSNLYFLKSDGSSFLLDNGNPIVTGGGNAVVAGSNKQIQYNNGGSMAASQRMIFNGSNTSFAFGRYDGGVDGYAVEVSTRPMGADSIAIGNGAYANSANSLALGADSAATGNGAFALGYKAIASGFRSTAVGCQGQALAYNSLSISSNGAVARENGSVVIGSFLDSNGIQSFIIGRGNDDTDPLVNNAYRGFMMGINSNAATLYVSRVQTLTNGFVGVGTSSVEEMLTINGVLSLAPSTPPSSVANYGKIFVSSDSKLYFLNSNGDQFALYLENLTSNGAVYINDLSDAKTTNRYSLFLGYKAGQAALETVPYGQSGAYYNTGVGYAALKNMGSILYASALGVNALNSIEDYADPYYYNNSNALGSDALKFGKGNYNNAIGANAMKFLGSSATLNQAAGFNSMVNAGNGSDNNAAGVYSLQNNDLGNGNIAMGAYSMQLNDNGNDNVTFGYRSLFNNRNGNGNVALGAYSLYELNNGSMNLAAGYQSGPGVNSDVEVNNGVYLGYRAGYSLQTGANNNILIGYKAGDNITTGANNIIIGHDLDAPSATANGQLYIGGILYGDIENGNIGIGTTSPKARLEVSSVYKLGPTDSPGTCNSDLEGGMYYDASMNELCFCNATNWKQFDGGGNCT